MDDIIRSFFDKLWALLHFILIVLKKLSGLALILLVLGLVIGFGITALLREHYSFEGFRLMGVTFFDFFQWLVPGLAIRWQYYFAALLAMIGLGGLFISLGLRLLVDWPPLRWQVMSIFGLCILGGLVLGSYTTYELQSSRHDNQMDYSRQVYKVPVNKRLIINLLEKNHEDFVMESRTKDKRNFITATDMVLGQTRLSIRPSETDSLTLVKMATASGKNGPEAQKYAAGYVHNLLLADSTFSFDQQYILSYEDGYHDHDLNYILSVPEGIKVYLNKNAYYTVPWSDFKDHNGKEGWYQMTKEGLLELPGNVVKDSIQ
jgi:hypothetical protein